MTGEQNVPEAPPGRFSFLTLDALQLPAAMSEPVKEPIMMPQPAVMNTTMDGVSLGGQDVVQKPRARRRHHPRC